MRDETSLAPTPAIVQTAVDLETTASAIDKILADVREGEAALHRASKVVDDWRCKAGALFAQVRRTLPASGPNARRWSEFVAARGISLDTAARYMKLAEHVAASPSETIAGKTVMDIYRELGIGAKPAGALEGAAAPAPAVAPPPVPSNQMALFGPALVAPPFAVPSAAQLPALGDPAPPAAEPSTSPRPLPTAKATPEDEAAERERAALAAVADLARMDAIEGTARAQGSLVMALRAHGGVPSGLMDTLHAAYAKFYEAERRKADLLDQPDTRPRSEPPAEVSEGDEDDDEDEDEDEEQDEEQDQGGEEERRRDEAQTAANVTRAQAEADEDEPCSVCGLDVCEDADACLAQAAKADGQADEDADAEEDAKPLPTPLTVLQGMVRHMTTDPARKEEVGAELLRLAGELGAVQVGELAREDLERLREVESQIGDRLRQVNGDGPCNPPNLVLALDLLIDAHRETMTEQEELLANLARLLNRWERIAPEDPTVDLRQLLAGRVDAAALTTANERDLTGALRIAERDLGRAEDRERVLYRALYRLASSWSVAPPADPRAALVAVLDSDEEIGRIAAASVRIEEEAQRTLGAVRDALESVAEALGIPPHGVAAAQLAQECCESIRQLSASPPQAARVLCEDPDCARYCDRPTDGGLALCDAHRPGAADARPVAEVLPALYWGTTWRDVGRSWAKPELRLPEISRWELDPEWIAATQLEHRAGLEWPVDLRRRLCEMRLSNATTLRELATHFKVSHERVRTGTLRVADMLPARSPGRGRRVGDDVRRRALELVRAGADAATAAGEVGHSRAAVCNWARAAGVAVPPRRVGKLGRPRRGTEYRPGLPDAATVRVHEPTGGWWQVRTSPKSIPLWAQMRVRRGAVELRWSAWPADQWSVPSSSNDVGDGWLCRPVTMPDGTPCAWPAGGPPR